MREWNHLSKIISANPIDYSQIEFYLLLAKKAGNIGLQVPSNHQTIGSSTSISDENKYRRNEKGYGYDRRNEYEQVQEKKSSRILRN